MNIAATIEALAAQGYVARRREALALCGLAAQQGGVRAVLLEGPPGCGKTSLAAAWAKATGAQGVYALLHSWSDADELFVGVDVCAAVAGDAANVRQSGVLARVAEASERGPVVLTLDELDKTQERVDGPHATWPAAMRHHWRGGVRPRGWSERARTSCGPGTSLAGRIRGRGSAPIV